MSDFRKNANKIVVTQWNMFVDMPPQPAVTISYLLSVYNMTDM